MTEKERYIERQMDALTQVWLFRVAYLAAALVVLLFVVDYVRFPDRILRFLALRVLLAVVLLSAGFLSRKHPEKGMAFHYTIGWAAVLLSAASVEFRVLDTGGADSPYYVAILMIAILIVGFVPAVFVFHLGCGIILLASYAGPLLAAGNASPHGAFAFQLGYLALSLVFLLLLGRINRASLRNEIGLKFEMERHAERLEEAVRDRTARLSDAVKELHVAKGKYEKLFRTSPDGILISTVRDGRIVEINETALALAGLVREEAVGRTTRELGCWADPSQRDVYVRHLVEDGAVRDFEMTLRSRAGADRPVLLSAVALEFGGEPCLMTVMRDISDYKRLQEQLRQAQKMEAVGHLAGGIAHDFNNILTAVTGYATLLQRDAPEGSELQTGLEHIVEAAERAAGLTRSLLAYSSKQLLLPRPVDLNVIVRNVQKLLERLIGEDVELALRLSEDAIVTMADAGQIEQVLMNLATNARDAMPQGGRLTLQTGCAEMDEAFVHARGFGRPGKYAVLRVSDTGVGMDPDTQKSIFEPFFTTKEKGRGTGLGLAMVYGTIRQHNGFIGVRSAPKAGAEFEIHLPVYEGPLPEREDPPKSAAVPCGGTESILLAEDDATIRRLAREYLESKGYRMIVAENGEEALEKFREEDGKLDLLVLDVVMPRKNGREVYEEAHRRKGDVRVLFISGYTGDLLEKRGILEEGMAFLNKPFTMDALGRKVREVLDRA